MADTTITKASNAADVDAAEAERRLGRNLAFGLPPAVVGIAIVVGTVTSVGPALLVLVAGALLGAIGLLWASIRTLGGDAPLSRDLEELAARTTSRQDLAERKRTVLRSLKDLEHEHAIGKIDDDDFAVLQKKYRDEAKDLLRELDLEVEPYREKAEALARKHLEKVGLAESEAAKVEAPPPADSEEDVAQESDEEEAEEAGEDDAGPTRGKGDVPAKITCAKCEASNDADAAFCKKCGASLAEKAADQAKETEGA